MVQLIFRNAGRFVLEKGNCLIVRGRVLIGILSIDGAKNVRHMGSILIRVLESVFDGEFLTLSVIPVIANERNGFRIADVVQIPMIIIDIVVLRIGCRCTCRFGGVGRKLEMRRVNGVDIRMGVQDAVLVDVSQVGRCLVPCDEAALLLPFLA